MSIARVQTYWACGSRSSPGIDAAASAGVAPQVRCQCRRNGVMRYHGRSARQSRSWPAMSSPMRGGVAQSPTFGRSGLSDVPTLRSAGRSLTIVLRSTGNGNRPTSSTRPLDESPPGRSERSSVSGCRTRQVESGRPFLRRQRRGTTRRIVRRSGQAGTRVPLASSGRQRRSWRPTSAPPRVRARRRQRTRR